MKDHQPCSPVSARSNFGSTKAPSMRTGQEIADPEKLSAMLPRECALTYLPYLWAPSLNRHEMNGSNTSSRLTELAAARAVLMWKLPAPGPGFVWVWSVFGAKMRGVLSHGGKARGEAVADTEYRTGDRTRWSLLSCIKS